MRGFRPILIVLLEPKISGEVANVICKKIGKNRWGRSKADGFSGGVWLVWNVEDIEVSIKHAHKFFTHIMLMLLGGRKWELTTMYASHNASERRSLRRKLDDMRTKNP